MTAQGIEQIYVAENDIIYTFENIEKRVTMETSK